MEVENISTVCVDHALHELTTVRGVEEHNVSVITPLQAMLAYNDFMAPDIKNINDADADRRRQEDGFTPRWDPSDIRYNNRGASVAIGASGAYGAPVANTSSGSKDSRRGDTRSDAPSSSKSRKLTQQDAQEASWSDCWVRPCKCIRPPSVSDFEIASRKANLNDGQRHVMIITGRPGTGKTQMSPAVIDAWARNASTDEIIIAAWPVEHRYGQPHNLLDRIVSLKDRAYRLGRLGEGKSVFDKKRVIFSLRDQAMQIKGRDAKKSAINRTVRQLISERKQSVLFTTYVHEECGAQHHKSSLHVGR